MGKIQTSIPRLDSLLNGGIDEKSVTCIIVKPGIDGTSFCYQLAAAAAQAQQKVFYFVNSKSPVTATRTMKEFGFSYDKINFIDAYSALVGAKTSSALLVANPKDPQEMLNEISIITKKIENPVIVIDSYSNLIDLTEKEDVKFLVALKKMQATVILLFTAWPYKSSFMKEVRNTVDTVIEVKTSEKKLFTRQYFGVTKMKNEKKNSQVIPFRVEKPGGIKIYIPKVLVTGPFNAGKTSFIHTSSDKAVSVDRLGTTIALDHGHLKYKDFSVDLFGTPGQQRFDPILKLLGGEALGVIVVVSSTDPQGFPRAIQMMKKAKVYKLPIVVAANKANLRGALKPEQIKKRLTIKDVDVVPVTAQDLTKVQPGLPCQLKKDEITQVLDSLFTKMMGK
jgi:uncharacterized protein